LTAVILAFVAGFFVVLAIAFLRSPVYALKEPSFASKQERRPDMPAADKTIYSARLRPHRSLTRAQAKRIVIATSALLTLVSLPFFALGAWPVIGFLGLDMLALWAAFEVSFHSARAYEDVNVSGLELALAHVTPRGRKFEWRFNPLWVRLEREAHEEFGLTKLELASGGRRVEFARFLGPDQKEDVARDLSAALMEARRGPDYSAHNAL
jgi:uncharacterized membrane protein